MTDLNENAPFDGVTEGSNTDTQEQSDIETVSESDAEIDAINEALAEAESDSTIQQLRLKTWKILVKHLEKTWNLTRLHKVVMKLVQSCKANCPEIPNS